MVTTVKTWTATINRTLGSTTDQGVQYQNFMYEWSEQLILAGWTHVASSNSSTVSSVTNLWTGPSDITWGIPTSARSFIILQAPATWGAPVGSDRFQLAIDCQATAGSTTPRTFTAYFATNAITATTTTAALTVPNNRHHAFTTNMHVFSWTAAAAARASFWRSSTGDVLWFTKLVSDSEFTRSGFVYDPINARGSWRGLAGMAGASSPTITVPWSAGNASGNTVGFTDAGASNGALGYGTSFVSPAHTFTSWASSATTGADSDGSVMFSQAIAGYNVSTQSQRRYYGTLSDLWFSQSTSFNLSDTSDTDPVVLRGFNKFALPVPTGTAALE